MSLVIARKGHDASAETLLRVQPRAAHKLSYCQLHSAERYVAVEKCICPYKHLQSVPKMLRWLAIGAAAAFAPPTRPPRRQAALHAETQAPSWKALRPRPGDVVIIDGDNCRGKSKWRLSASDVDAAAAARTRAASWVKKRS